MNFRILLLALVAFSFLLAGCGGKRGEAPPVEPAEELPAEEPEPEEEAEGEDEAEGEEEEGGESDELAELFDIEINEPPEDFDYGKAPGEE